jgi:hypothetical protein
MRGGATKPAPASQTHSIRCGPAKCRAGPVLETEACDSLRHECHIVVTVQGAVAEACECGVSGDSLNATGTPFALHPCGFKWLVISAIFALAATGT